MQYFCWKIGILSNLDVHDPDNSGPGVPEIKERHVPVIQVVTGIHPPDSCDGTVPSPF